MKVNLSALERAARTNKNEGAVIGLETVARRDDNRKDNFESFKCYKDPTDTTTTSRLVKIYHFDNESPEELLIFLEKLEDVQAGTGATTGPELYTTARHVLKGMSLTTFNNAAAQNGNETVTNYKKCIEALKKGVFPTRAARRQKQAMNGMRKPRHWTMRQYAARMTHLANQLKSYPKDGQRPNPKFADDELIQCVENNLPNGYKRFMQAHGYYSVDHDMSDFVSFVEERIEPTDTKEEAKPKAASNKKNRRDKDEQAKKPNKRQKAEFYCKHHGANHSHNTEDCRHLKFNKNNGNGKQKYDKEEVHVLIQQTADKAARDAVKRTNAAWKKRLRAKDSHLMDDVSSSISKLDLDESSVDSEYSA